MALREALLTLLERTAFDQITIRDICAEAGVHYATFFRHHQTKEALLGEIAAEQTSRLSELAMAIRQTRDTKAGFMALCAYVDEHRDLWSTLLNGGAGGAMREEWMRQTARVAAGEPPANTWLPVQLGAICAATLIAEGLAWWVAQPADAYSATDMAEMLYRLLTSPIMAGV
ncbi:MAG: TetR family transcriptional regulator [Sphingomonas sp.]